MTENKIDTLMSRGNGAIRHAYFCILEAAKADLCYGVSSSNTPMVTLLADTNERILLLSSAGDTLTGDQVENAVGSICDNVVEMMHEGAIDEDEMSDIITVFVNEFIPTETSRALLLEDYIEETSYWQSSSRGDDREPVFPITADLIFGISHKTLAKHVLNDDEAFEQYCAALEELSHWDYKWDKAYFWQDEAREKFYDFQSWLLTMSEQGYLSVSEALAYASEVYVVEMFQRDSTGHRDTETRMNEVILSEIAALDDVQQRIVAQTMGYSASFFGSEILDMEALFSHVVEISPEDIPPASVLARMVAVPFMCTDLNLARNSGVAMRAFEERLKG